MLSGHSLYLMALYTRWLSLLFDNENEAALVIQISILQATQRADKKKKTGVERNHSFSNDSCTLEHSDFLRRIYKSRTSFTHVYR